VEESLRTLQDLAPPLLDTTRQYTDQVPTRIQTSLSSSKMAEETTEREENTLRRGNILLLHPPPSKAAEEREESQGGRSRSRSSPQNPNCSE
jgi:hypothetical protein